MQGQRAGTNLFCIYQDCVDLALFGDYCKTHQEQRAEAAEAEHVKDVENLRNYMTLADNLQAERDAFIAQDEAVHRAVNEMCGTDTSTIEAVQHVIDERDEAKQQYAALMQSAMKIERERDVFRNGLEAIRAETIMPDGTRLSEAVKLVMQERDELRDLVDTQAAQIDLMNNAIAAMQAERAHEWIVSQGGIAYDAERLSAMVSDGAEVEHDGD